MPVQRFLALSAAGVTTEALPVDASAGVADNGKLVALDAAGRLGNSMMPVGVAAETAMLPTSEALTAGNFVNVYLVSTTSTARKADATTTGKTAQGFVLANVASGATAEVYLAGINNALTGLTVGPVFLGTTAGQSTPTAPTAAGQVVQRLGDAINATTMVFNPQPAIPRA